MISLFLGYSLCFSQNDPRQHNHSAVILKFKQDEKIKYYVTWSSSADDTWEHDIYREIIFFENGKLKIESGPECYIGTGTDEAQEPVSADITAENIILSAWEDGSGNTVDIRGQLHHPNGTIIKSNWIIAGGTESQHSPTVCHLGDKFLVAYTDEAPPAEHAMNKVKVLNELDGSEQKLFEVTSTADDNWWPVACDNNKNHAFIGWADGETFYGSVFSFVDEQILFTHPRAYAFNINMYHYQVSWLEHLQRFIAVVKTKNNSFVSLIDTNGVRTNWGSVDAPIIREASLTAKWDSFTQSYKVVFPIEEHDVAVVKVTASEIELFDLINGDENPLLQIITWPSTGTSSYFIQDTDGKDIWESQNIVLFATNRNNSDDVLLLPVRLQAGFATGVTNQSETTNISDSYFLVKNYPNPFHSFTNFNFNFSKNGDFKITIYNSLGQLIKQFPIQAVNQGELNIKWNGRDDFGRLVSNGLYFVLIEFCNKRIIKKIITFK